MAISVSASRPGDLPPRPETDCLRSGPAQADRRLLLLHGWGADADDLLALGTALVDPAVSVVALRAPQSHPAGVGRQWYPLMPEPAWEQLPAARTALLARLARLAQEVPLERTAVLGFSQGAAMAVDTVTGGGEGFPQGVPLAALIGCSGYPHPGWLPQRPRCPILLTHGEQDDVVPVRACGELARLLRQAGGSVEPHRFRGGHGIDPHLIPRLRGFLAEGWDTAA
jgi:phospholipase/carboxylesterase